MRKSFFIIIILGLTLAVGLAFFFLKNKPSGGTTPTNQANQNQDLSAAQVNPVDYETQLKIILAPFWQDKNPAGLKEKIMSLVVPGQYKDLHLQLVIALSQIETGQAQGHQEDIEAGFEKIDQLTTDYPWLAP